MGFGILFVGYLLGLNILAKQGIFWGLSSLFMLYALTKLYVYNDNFKKTFRVAIPMTVFAVVFAVLEVLDMLGKNTGTAITYFNTVRPIFSAVFTYFLLCAVRDIAKETECVNIFQRAYVQRFFLFIVYIPYILLNFKYDVPSGVPTVIMNVLYLVFSVFAIVYIAVNAKLLFSCYMWICLPEDIDMPAKKEREQSESDVLDVDDRNVTETEEEHPPKRACTKKRRKP